MKIQFKKTNFLILFLLIFAAIPQLVVYNEGYYYNSATPTSVKYIINILCFLGVSICGYRYLQQQKTRVIYKIWIAYYGFSGFILLLYYTYKYFSKSFDPATYLRVMAIFEFSASPMPFIIAWLLVKLVVSLEKKDI